MHCLYCNAPITDGNRSGEHVFKRSVLRRLGILKHRINLRHIGPAGTLVSRDRTPVLDRLKSYRVCDACNSQWINDQDLAIEDLLCELAEGDTHRLSRDSLIPLARWLFRSIVTLRSTYSDPTFDLPLSVRLRMHQPGYLPSGFAAWAMPFVRQDLERIQAGSTSTAHWSVLDEQLLARMQREANVKGAIFLGAILMGFALSSLRVPVYAVPRRSITLATHQATLIHHDDPFPPPVGGHFESNPMNWIEQSVYLAGGETSLRGAVWR